MIDRLLYDKDNAVLAITMHDGTEYIVTNAGHAKKLHAKLRPGMTLSPEQASWIACYRSSKPVNKRDTLIQRLRDYRTELRASSSVLTNIKR